ncbi:hypothetical protein [Umezakia ovalisporum]|nr:hypothetical protein [Umezakia ovalisporum]MDH6087348.1 hypothetical protein [Umezakia ovalisporum Ak1311]
MSGYILAIALANEQNSYGYRLHQATVSVQFATQIFGRHIQQISFL